MNIIVSRPARAPSGQVSGAWLVVVLGVCALVGRLGLWTLPPAWRAPALAAVAGSILLASLLVPIPRDPRPAPLTPSAGLVLGLAAVAAATLATGRPLRLPFVAWAVPLSVLAAVAEEALFRRVAYGWLQRWGVPVAVVGSAVVFAAIHVPLYGIAVLPVDLGAGLVLSWQRWATGTWTVPASTHAAANVLATVLR